MPKFDIDVTRVGVSFATIHIAEAADQAEAEQIALDEAGNHSFSEKSSEYELTHGAHEATNLVPTPVPTVATQLTGALDKRKQSLYLSAQSDNDYADTPRYLFVEVSPKLIAQIKKLADLVSKHQLNEVDAYCKTSVGWSEDAWTRDLGMGPISMTITNSQTLGPSFQFGAYPKHSSYRITTPMVDLRNLIVLMDSGETELYVGDEKDYLQECVEEDRAAAQTNEANDGEVPMAA